MDRVALDFLRASFPDRPLQQLEDIVLIVAMGCPNDSPEQKLENMINMLDPQTQLEEEEEEEGAVGYALDIQDNVRNLQNVFPEASKDFLVNYCVAKGSNFFILEAIDELLKDGYVKRNSNDIWKQLQEALPGADPEYLKKQAEMFCQQNPEQLQIFLADAIENQDYPTKEEFLKRKKEEDTLNTFKNDHNEAFVSNFLEQFPDPECHFRDPNRPNPLQSPDVQEEDILYAKTFLYNKYPFVRKCHIDLVFTMKARRLFDCCYYLDGFKKEMKQKRAYENLPESKNLALIQEVAYLKYRGLFRRVVKYKLETYNQFKEEARQLGLLKSCDVCGETELIPEECALCDKGCVFCKGCVQRFVEVKMGEGCTKFPCCGECDSQFSLYTLQCILPSAIFQKLLIKIQSEELKQARVDGIETCPFCDFVSIPIENSTVFYCKNQDCLKESCRLCRHESHIPKRCNEIEYDEDVRRRTYIENMMTEALARTCYQCNKKFIKDTGCNKMVCSCGAKMCYLCLQPINGYDHFGGGKPCQLFTNDLQVNLERVKQRANLAKNELGNVEIKFDPSKDIDRFYT